MRCDHRESLGRQRGALFLIQLRQKNPPSQIKLHTQADALTVWIHFELTQHRMSEQDYLICDQTIPQRLKQTKVGLQRTVRTASTVGIASAEGRRLSDLKPAPVGGCWQLNSHSPVTFSVRF